MKETWKGIRNLINVSKKSSTNISKLADHNKETSDPKEMADMLNSFYVNIGKTTEDKFPKGRKVFSDYLHGRNIYNIVLNPCTTEEIREYISKLAPLKALGPHSIPISILKNYIDQLIEPLTVVINKSLSEGIFPDLMKFASVCPIYIKYDRTKCANYRPISLLSNLSKNFERAMYNRIELFLSRFDTIYKLQFGFRKKHSTKLAIGHQ